MEQFGVELKNFKIQSFIDVLNEYIRADEIERAMWVMDNLPAFYRDHIPSEIVIIKNEMLKRMATPRVYSGGDVDCQNDASHILNMHKTLRGGLISKDIKNFNDQNITPHVVDFCPGEYWLPIVLKHQEFKFTYDPIYMNERAFQSARPKFDKYLSKDFDQRPVIYMAGEIIEHLYNENEVKTEMLYNCGLADIVHVSTPRYTFDCRDLDWRDTKEFLGHLRAYTPREFFDKLTKMFIEYQGFFFNSQILHARMILRDSKFIDKIDKTHEA